MNKINKLIKEKEILIMGILNFTPDSFSDGGDFFNIESALAQVEKMINDGADIIDIGCESTGPGAEKVSVEDEILRLKLILPIIRKHFPNILISIDTYKSEVATFAVENGADIINDVYGAKNNNMAEVAKKYNVPIIVMHNGGTAKGNEISSLVAELRESVDICLESGVKRENIIVDPGIGLGFGKEAEENLIITNELQELERLGCTILYAASRKSTTDFILGGGTNPKDRDVVSAVLSLEAIRRGAKIVRMHNVKIMKETIDTYHFVNKASKK